MYPWFNKNQAVWNFLSLELEVMWRTAAIIRGGAYKSLARPRRKQATATKLGIYSPYSPGSSIHFLARCSNFGKALKNSEGCPSNQVPAAAMTSASDEKWWLSNFFSVHGSGGSPTGPDPENRVGDQDIWSPSRPVSSGLQVSGEPGHFRVRTRAPWWTSSGVFLQNVLQLYQQRWVILHVDSLALWKIINEEGAVLIPKYRGQKFSKQILALRIFGGGVSRYAAIPLIVALSPGHSKITRFFMVTYGCAIPLMFLSEWREFPSAPCLAENKKLDDSSQLGVVEIARVSWHASFQPL